MTKREITLMTTTKKNPSIDPSSRRWFLDCDEDGHFYVVPCDCRAKWEAWLAIPWTEKTPPPSFARQVDALTGVTFLDPIETTTSPQP